MIWNWSSGSSHRRTKSCSSSSTFSPSGPCSASETASSPTSTDTTACSSLRSSPVKCPKGFVHSPTASLSFCSAQTSISSRPELQIKSSRFHRRNSLSPTSTASLVSSRQSTELRDTAHRHSVCSPPSLAGSLAAPVPAPESHQMSVREDVEEDQCPVCLCELSLRLQGEKPHVVPACQHRLHHDCFEAVYGNVERARTKPPGSLGLCGICRKDMKIGDAEQSPTKKNKFTTMAGLPQADDRSSHKMHSTTCGTLRDDHEVDRHDPMLDDDLFLGGTGRIPMDPIGHSYRDTFSTSSTGSTITAARRGSLATSSGSGSSIHGVPATNNTLEIVRPVLKVRSEYPSVERSGDPNKTQHMTCMITIEMPSRWPTPMPLVEGITPEYSCSAPSSPSSFHGHPLQSATRLMARLALDPPDAAKHLPALDSDASKALVQDLKARMADWKGHAPDEFGTLLLHETLLVKKDDNVREFAVNLFNEAILCVTDEKRRGLAGKLADSLSGLSDRLRLKGRVYIRHIRSIVDSSVGPNLTLTIIMSEDALDDFILTFDTRRKLDLWHHHISRLISTSAGGLARAAPGMVASTSHETFTSEQSDRSYGTQLSAFSGYTRTTTSSGPPLTTSTVYEEDESGGCSEAQRYASSSRYPASSYNSTFSPLSASISSRLPGTPISPASISSAQLREWPSLDLMLILSVPPSGSPSTLLKIGIIRSSLAFLLAHAGSKTRISVVLYTAGESSRGATLHKTPYIAIGTSRGRQRFEQAVAEIGEPRMSRSSSAQSDRSVLQEHQEERVSVVTACNLALDIVLQRKTKAALSGIIVVNDGRGDANKQQMDLLLARAEAANTPIHTLGWGKAHDPASLWLMSNHTSGSYTFVRDLYDLRDSLAGVVGGILSIAATNVRLHIAVLEQRSFRIRKVSGIPGAVISKTGSDVDIDLGELRFGDRRELLVEVEMALGSKGPRDTAGAPMGLGLGLRGANTGPESGVSTATDEFFLARAGMSPSELGTNDGAGSLYDDEYDSMPDEVPLFEVNAAYRDPAAGKTVSRLNHTPTLLTITAMPAKPSHTDHQSPVPGGIASPKSPSSSLLAGSNIDITRRRLELLTSEMLSRALLLMTRRNDQQAARVLEETKRIIATIAQTSLGLNPATGLTTSPSSFARPSSHLHAVAHARKSLHACTESVQTLLEGCADRTRFETQERYAAAQNAVILREQRAVAGRSSVERLFWMEDNSRWLVSKSHSWIHTR